MRFELSRYFTKYFYGVLNNTILLDDNNLISARCLRVIICYFFLTLFHSLCILFNENFLLFCNYVIIYFVFTSNTIIVLPKKCQCFIVGNLKQKYILILFCFYNFNINC